MKHLKMFLLLCFVLLSTLLLRPQVVHAATAPNILLVYDSLNAGDRKQNNVAAMQRLLTSAGATVRLSSVSNYQRGGLARGDYSGLVTMINWDDVPVANRVFLREQRDFTGPQLHVGGNLTAGEVAKLHAHKQTLYRRQLQGSLPHGSTQLLPYSTAVNVLTDLPAGARTYGTLRIQGASGTYPFAYQYQQAAFLPYFDGQGLSLLAAERLVAQMFASQVRTYRPLLTITGVTPYSNLSLLKQTAAFLDAHGISFAVSAATVTNNTELPEFARYAAALRSVQAAGGVVFVRMPQVGAPGAQSGPLLNANMTTAITALSQKHVFPVGYSLPTYLQLDAVFKRSALSGANTVLQLANPALQAYAQKSDRTQAYKRAYTSVSAASLNRNKSGRPLSARMQSFALPTAVTFKMPDSAKELAGLRRRVADFNFDWENTAALNTKLTVATLVLEHRHGQYYMNGRLQAGNYTPVAKPPVTESLPSRINNFFAIQSTFLWIFFAITITAMVGLLVLGRKVYLQMYRRK
ncbi:hypothetical protein [Lacticaseibacillus zhaodongensis]|uniref:hypothetical protein n=1 Tax=Lacticaseibacillus zhaodongensis TaxID=2668065 RepID=UPI0012D2F2C5|nr:hypothetical protein [Lacticaseibacillus zhaodongensis]